MESEAHAFARPDGRTLTRIVTAPLLDDAVNPGTAPISFNTLDDPRAKAPTK